MRVTPCICPGLRYSSPRVDILAHGDKVGVSARYSGLYRDLRGVWESYSPLFSVISRQKGVKEALLQA